MKAGALDSGGKKSNLTEHFNFLSLLFSCESKGGALAKWKFRAPEQSTRALSLSSVCPERKERERERALAAQ